jgi:hypothetical protein
MTDDLNLVGVRYNLILTVFFIFYLAYETSIDETTVLIVDDL